jgi:hypothetical protein
MIHHLDTPQARGRAGLAHCDITPPVGIYHRMWGAARHDRSTGVHRPLRATALWIESISSTTPQVRVVLSLDHCLFDTDEFVRIRRAAAGPSGLAPEQVLVTLSHTHGAGLMSRTRSHLPGGDLIAPYLDDLAQKCAQVVSEARQKSRPATLLFGSGRCALAAHRDFYDTERRVFACGFNPEGFADDTVLVMSIVADTGAMLGSIVNYACHPTTLAWDNTAISPDYVGALREAIEQHTGAPCLFLQGASGDLGPRVGYVGDHTVTDRNGRQLAFAALAALEALPSPGLRFCYQGPVVSGALLGAWAFQPLPEDVMQRHSDWHIHDWTEPLAYRHDLPTMAQTEAEQSRWEAEEARARAQGDEKSARDCRAQVERMVRQTNRLSQLPAGKTYPLAVYLWRWGDAFWVFVPGEHYQSLQTTLRGRFPHRPVVVTTLTNDWQPGYLPPASTYGYGVYQETIAVVAAGSAELLIESITRRIRELSGV